MSNVRYMTLMMCFHRFSLPLLRLPSFIFPSDIYTLLSSNYNITCSRVVGQMFWTHAQQWRTNEIKHYRSLVLFTSKQEFDNTFNSQMDRLHIYTNLSSCQNDRSTLDWRMKVNINNIQSYVIFISCISLSLSVTMVSCWNSTLCQSSSTQLPECLIRNENELCISIVIELFFLPCLSTYEQRLVSIVNTDNEILQRMPISG